MNPNSNAAQAQTDNAACSFSIYPVCDNYAPIILNALQKADRYEVSRRTDGLETCVHGATAQVFAATRAAFVHSAAAGPPTAFRATFTLGVQPYITANPVPDLLATAPDVSVQIRPAQSIEHVLSSRVRGKLAIYSLGMAQAYPNGSAGRSATKAESAPESYVPWCLKQLEDSPLAICRTHDAIHFEGALHLVWSEAEQCLCAGRAHTVMELCVLANSRLAGSAHTQNIRKGESE